MNRRNVPIQPESPEDTPEGRAEAMREKLAELAEMTDTPDYWDEHIEEIDEAQWRAWVDEAEITEAGL